MGIYLYMRMCICIFPYMYAYVCICMFICIYVQLNSSRIREAEKIPISFRSLFEVYHTIATLGIGNPLLVIVEACTGNKRL